MFDWMFSVEGWGSLLTLTLLEIVLGIDNLVFLSIASQKLPKDQRKSAQRLGLAGALVLRIAMLSMLVWLTQLTRPVFTYSGFALSWRDIILFAGGVFLIWKATMEIHQEVEGEPETTMQARTSSFAGVVMLIVAIDLVFALDSIVTAVGMTSLLPVMILANVIAIIMMLAAAGKISDFIDEHPTLKMLAMAFILLIGIALVADGLHYHIPRGFLYSAIVFSLAIEVLNTLVRTKSGRRSGRDNAGDIT